MPKEEFVGRKEFENLVDLVNDMEAEMMGDERTKRPSLRVELTDKMNSMHAINENKLKFISRVSVGVLIAVLVAVFLNLFGLTTRPTQAQTHPTEQSK